MRRLAFSQRPLPPLSLLGGCVLAGLAGLAGLVGGCGRERAEPAGSSSRTAADAREEPASCEAVLGQLRRVLTVELAPIPGATVPLARALAIGARSCAEDGWPLPLRRCVLEVPLAGAVPALLHCAELAPPELRRRLEREVREAALGAPAVAPERMASPGRRRSEEPAF